MSINVRQFFLYLDKDAMDYFRALLRSGEKSERALQLTGEIISMNPTNYNVWFVIYLYFLLFIYLFTLPY